MNSETFPVTTFICRDYSLEEVELLASVLAESQISYGLEIPLTTVDAFEMLDKIKQRYPNLMLGAGTVQTLDELVSVAKLNIQFVLSPQMMTKEMLTYCHDNQILSIPGAFSPTEIATLHKWGADIIKVFPITTLGLTYLNDIQVPLGQMKLMAVGGVTTKTARLYLANGASYVGIGSGVFNKRDIQLLNEAGIRKSLAEFEDALG